MSKEALAKVVQRAISDAGFRRQLNSDPAGALRGFDLSADELSALRTGNAGRLSSLGVDQRMSKAFAIGGAVAATRMSQSDLTAGSPAMVDDASGLGSRTIIPAYPETDASADAHGTEAMRANLPIDPDRVVAADVDPGTGGTSTVRAGGDDWKLAGRQAPEGAGTRTGDDWKFADRTSQAAAAPVEGSPEATAADIAGGGSVVRSNVDDDPDGFLAANANADLSGSAVRSNVDDDPDGFLAANANADLSGGTSRGDGTAFVDESEAYLTKVGYDANAATSAVTDAHDRGGDNIVTRIDDDAADSAGTSAASEHGPNISS